MDNVNKYEIILENFLNELSIINKGKFESDLVIPNLNNKIQELNTIKETQEILRISSPTIYKLINQGKLELIKVASKSFISGKSISAILNIY